MLTWSLACPDIYGTLHGNTHAVSAIHSTATGVHGGRVQVAMPPISTHW